MDHATKGQSSLSSDWTRSLRALWDLDAAERISSEAWDEILDWMRTTQFGEKSFVAGEAAAKLIREKAPEAIRAAFLGDVRKRVTAENDEGDWLLHLGLVAMSPKDMPSEPTLITRALASENFIVAEHARQNFFDPSIESQIR